MELVYRSSSSVQGVEQAADINNGFLDIRLGPTLSCLVAEKKKNSQITYFYETTTGSFNHLHPSPQTLPLCPSLHIPTEGYVVVV